jgi:putative membrane protein
MSATTDDGVPPHSGPHFDEGTRLSLQRTQLAAERTLMAWIRTAFSMISFGFTIGKFLQYLHEKPGREGAEHGSLLPPILVVLGLASLVVGLWEFRHTMRVLNFRIDKPAGHTPVGIIASLVALIGLLALISLFVRTSFL